MGAMSVEDLRRERRTTLLGPGCHQTGPSSSHCATIDETKNIHVRKNEDETAGVLRVRTMDCCIPGDAWTALIQAKTQGRFRNMHWERISWQSISGWMVAELYFVGYQKTSSYCHHPFFPMGLP